MTTADDPDIAAVELALGVLDGEERAAAMRRVLADPAFAREVASWRERFAVFFAEWPDAVPDSLVEARVLAGLSKAPSAARPWRWAVLAGSVAAACLLLITINRPDRTVLPPAPRPTASLPQLIAVLTPTKGPPFSAIYDSTRREVRIAEHVPVPAGRTAQLWSIGADAVPRSLGLLASLGPARVVLRGSKVDVPAGATLAISLEPQGGSPTGLPTGPIVAKGKLTIV